VSLRGQGRSFSAIARQLGMRRSSDAYRSFHRGLAARSESECRQLASDELARLAALEVRIRSRDALVPDKMSRRLQGLDQMRADLTPHLGGENRDGHST
jgi:hypothetical protein